MRKLALILSVLVALNYLVLAQVQLQLDGSIQISGDTVSLPMAGSIRWTGIDFEGWNGFRWVSLSGDEKIGTVTDIDGNVYRTWRIDTLEWMIDNLRTTRMNDGTPIPNHHSAINWLGATTPALCWYNNDSATYANTYGVLYNWYTAESPNICPTGWHVPNYLEIVSLVQSLGGVSVAGGLMKESGDLTSGTGLWLHPNVGASNTSGFSGRPGGSRAEFTAAFQSLNEAGRWWTSEEFVSDPQKGWAWILSNAQSFLVYIVPLKSTGQSIRCVKN